MQLDGQLVKQIVKLMRVNRRQSGPFTYTVPSPDSYPYQWFWDSCFHAVILSHFDVSSAKHELLSLVHWQFKNGMIPHMIYWPGLEKGGQFPTIEGKHYQSIHWGKRHTSSLIQPPMLAYAAWRIYLVDGDREFLAGMLPPIHHLHNYLLRQRDPRHHHLVGLIHPDESGEDNSPRFDHALHMRSRQRIEENYRRRLRLIERYRTVRFVVARRMDRAHWVRDVPMNAILVENLRAEARIAEVLGDIHAAALALERAERVKQAMRTHMLSGCMMYSTYGLEYEPIRMKTWAIFAPLFAELLTRAEADELVRGHLLNKREFMTPYGVPTVAKSEPSFDPMGFWRGPTWMATNWFIYVGLRRYGFDEEAEAIARTSRELLGKSGFREQYHPVNGDGMGATNFTWGGLVIDMDSRGLRHRHQSHLPV
jgi:glycogen debranching enzyme